MMGIIVAPEFGVAMAMADFLSAQESLAATSTHNVVDLDAVALEEGSAKGANGDRERPREEKMTRSHAFFSNMGGFKAKVWCRNDTPGVPVSYPESGQETDRQSLIDTKRDVTLHEGVVSNYAGLG